MEISTRKIIGFNVTCNPTLVWVKQQIREATAFGVQPRILIHDNDGIYGQFGKDRRSHLGYRSHLDYWLKETDPVRHAWLSLTRRRGLDFMLAEAEHHRQFREAKDLPEN